MVVYVSHSRQGLYMSFVNIPDDGPCVRLALLFILLCVFFLFVSSVFPCLVLLWLPEEVLTLLFLLHREKGDFSILMKDIC